jgi:hypothetical protein
VVLQQAALPLHQLVLANKLSQLPGDGGGLVQTRNPELTGHQVDPQRLHHIAGVNLVRFFPRIFDDVKLAGTSAVGRSRAGTGFLTKPINVVDCGATPALLVIYCPFPFLPGWNKSSNLITVYQSSSSRAT